MKHYWLLLALSVVVGTTAAWTMNYAEYGHRDAFFGEIDIEGNVTADNVMEKLKEYHSDSAARVELDEDPTFDFGAMPPGSEGKHTFTLRNTGTEPLELELGATTCKCTLGDLLDNELGPGESTKVELEWTVKAQGTSFEQSAELRTNDPSRPAIRFMVKGLVIRDIEFVPKQITFGEVLAGEKFDFVTRMYSYYPQKIEPQSVQFGSSDLNKFADVEIEPVEVTAADGVHKNARQCFVITANVKPGVRQGSLATSMEVAFKKTDEYFEGIDPSEDENVPRENEVGDGTLVAVAECAGRVIGALTLLPTPEIRTTKGGGYVWSLGRLSADDKLEYRALVALKGSEKDSTNLTIGETYPSDVVTAEFGKPLGKGQMRLFPLNLTLKGGEQQVDLLGKNVEDLGWLWIESDNPKVGRLKVAVKVLIEPRP